MQALLTSTDTEDTAAQDTPSFINRNINDVNRRLRLTIERLTCISETLSDPLLYEGKGEGYKLCHQIQTTDQILLHMKQLLEDADTFRRRFLPINDDLKKILELYWHVHDNKNNTDTKKADSDSDVIYVDTKKPHTEDSKSEVIDVDRKKPHTEIIDVSSTDDDDPDYSIGDSEEEESKDDYLETEKRK